MAEPTAENLRRLEAALGYSFADAHMMRRALTHRSYIAEHPEAESYERLEFLGDAVLQLAVTDDLYQRYPELAEGEMAKVRAAVVNETTLAGFARRFGISEVLLLGRGELQTGGREKDSILSDVIESLLGAVYLEAGYELAADLIRTHWETIIDERASAPGRRDYKTRLQEVLAQRSLYPIYEVTESGPEHAKRFIARVEVEREVLGEGSGTSKKRAEQAAARVAFERLGMRDA